MIAVIFEAQPKAGMSTAYLAMAAQLRSQLDHIDGFISIERFESVAQPGAYLSLSFWRDEAAVRRWRNLPSHRHAQHLGRNEIFLDYRLRVATVIRDYGPDRRAEAPQDSNCTIERLL